MVKTTKMEVKKENSRDLSDVCGVSVPVMTKAMFIAVIQLSQFTRKIFLLKNN